MFPLRPLVGSALVAHGLVGALAIADWSCAEATDPGHTAADPVATHGAQPVEDPAEAFAWASDQLPALRGAADAGDSQRFRDLGHAAVTGFELWIRHRLGQSAEAEPDVVPRDDLEVKLRDARTDLRRIARDLDSLPAAPGEAWADDAHAIYERLRALQTDLNDLHPAANAPPESLRR